MRDYGNPSYWDERYAAQDGSCFDWYHEFRILKPYLEPFLSRDPSFEIFIPGCGNSKLGAEIYNMGCVNLTCVDTSPVVINQMSDRYADKEEMECTLPGPTKVNPQFLSHLDFLSSLSLCVYLSLGLPPSLGLLSAAAAAVTVMDVRAMEMPDGCFDLIIDKGLFDAQLCGEDNPTSITTMVAEISRVLKAGGAYVVVSHGKPASRLGYLQKPQLQWDVQVIEIPKNSMDGVNEGASPCYYMYTCRKSSLGSPTRGGR